jgi:hypothetical protein
MSKQENNQETTSQVSRVSLKIPPFWKSNPALWFKQLESQFINCGIVQDSAKYHAVVPAIESNILSEVSDIIMKTPENNMYEKLKTTMINRFLEPETTKLKKILHTRTFELGDKRPSQLLREMQKLSDNKFSDDVLKILWIQRLPAQCQTVLSCFDSELEELASKADKIMQATTNTVINEATADPPAIFQNLQNQVEELIQKVGTYGDRTLTLDFNFKKFTRKFLIADVSKPIIGSDFLNHFDLLVDIKKERIFARSEITPYVGNANKETTMVGSADAYMDFASQFLLKEFTDISSSPGNGNITVKHNVRHRIETVGPPIFSKARRLSPEKKLKTASGQAHYIWFQERTENGVHAETIAG